MTIRNGSRIASSAIVPPDSFSARLRVRLMIRRRVMVLPYESAIENGNYHRGRAAARWIESARTECRSDVFDEDRIVSFVDELVHEELADLRKLHAVFARTKLRLVDDRHEYLAPVRRAG